MLRTDDSLTLKTSLRMSIFKVQFSAWTFCPIKTKNVQTNINFGGKMSNVRPLFRALHTGVSIEHKYLPHANAFGDYVKSTGAYIVSD